MACLLALIYVSCSMVPFCNHGESLMPSLTIKGVPDDLLDRLRQSAEEHRRSLNGEVLHRLERSVGGAPVDPEAFLARVRRLRQRTNLPPLTDEMLEKARNEGRP